MATPAILPENLPYDRADTPSSLPAPPKKPYKPQYWLHALLFVFTLLTTTAIGMRYMANFQAGRFPLSADSDIFPYDWAFHHPAFIPSGLAFSATLLAILLTHEFGHYFACRAYNIKATLPYLLPAPSLSGTAGAVIRLRSRVKTRAALIAIGALGPLSGFVVAVIMAIVGITLSHPITTASTRLVEFKMPLLMDALFLLTGHHDYLTNPQLVLWHPVFIASWIGVLITALNLIPAGQLDGGHILYAVNPRAHRWVTWATMTLLGLLGLFCWIGWLLWMGILFLPGMRHPRVDDPTPLAGWQLALAPAAVVMLVLCAVYQPFDHASGLQAIPRIYEVLKELIHLAMASITNH